MKGKQNRVAIYAATFIPIVDVEDSVQSQIDYCKAVIANAKPNYIMIGSYQDEVRSLDAKRPFFEQLIIDARNKKFDHIAITDLKLLDHNREKRNEILDLLGSLDIYVLEVPKPPKKKLKKNEPRHIKWIPDPEIQSLFEVAGKKKSVEDHKAEFGSDKKGKNEE